MRRSLALRKETLTELAAADLTFGGAAQALPTTPAANCVDNLSDMIRNCDSLLRPCISNTCTL